MLNNLSYLVTAFNFREFETILKSIRWAQQAQDPLTFTPSRDNLIKLQLLAEYLFLVIYVH